MGTYLAKLLNIKSPQEYISTLNNFLTKRLADMVGAEVLSDHKTVRLIFKLRQSDFLMLQLKRQKRWEYPEPFWKSYLKPDKEINETFDLYFRVFTPDAVLKEGVFELNAGTLPKTRRRIFMKAYYAAWEYVLSRTELKAQAQKRRRKWAK